MLGLTRNGVALAVLAGALLQLKTASANLDGSYQPTTFQSASDSKLWPAIASDRPTPQTQARTPTSPTASPIGINLSGVEYWKTQLPFVDAFKVSSPWLSQKEGGEWEKGGPLALTKEGWVASLQPGQYAEKLMFYGNGGNFPGGNYTVLYEGDGKVEIGFGKQEVVSQQPGRMVVKIAPSDSGISLQVRATNPANPVRNIRVIMPGFENTYTKQPFNPLFLERLKGFKVLRFMDWQYTNNSPVKSWAERTTPNSVTQGSDRGVALEHMIQLANTLQIDVWFCMPHQVDDNYVRQFATMVRDRLNPNLKIYIEYSNEVWNGSFSQYKYAAEKGIQLGLRDAGDTGEGLANLRYYAQRSVEMFKIWQQVFGDTQRLEKVLAVQGGNRWAGEQVITWKDAYKYADHYAIATYFAGGESPSGLANPQNAERISKMSAEQILDLLPKDIEYQRDELTATANLARKYKLKLTSYEGGVDLISANAPEELQDKLTSLYSQVNRNPRMKTVYMQYLTQWKQIGGGLLNQFNDVERWSKWGCWGAMEYLAQDPKQAPKYQALKEFIQANPSTR